MKRWLGVIVLMLVVSIAYMDRINVSLMITNKDFLLTLGLEGDRIAQGRLMSLFLFGYGLSAWFLTPLFEARWSVRASLLISLVLWTAFTGASALTTSVVLFLSWRFLLGSAEGPLFSLKTMYVKEHFAPHEVGKPNAVSSLGVSIGLGAGYSILSFLIQHFGWRDSFWALAALNVLIGVPLVALFIQAPKATTARAAGPKPAAMSLMLAALRTPHLFWILIIEICTLSYLWGASTWLPSYLKEARHFSLAEMSVFAGLPFIVGIVAGVVGGSFVDMLPRHRAPLAFVVGGIITAIFVTLAIVAENPYVAATALILAGAGWGFQAPAIPTLVQHVAREGTVGSTYGVVNGVGNLVSALMPMVMGAAMMAGKTENLGQGFWLLVGTQLLTVVAGAALLWRLGRRLPAATAAPLSQSPA
ncbi:MFS transporter [Bradyrhizobium sp. U87765 SZCCT0131]|uniref:MFS transporter n=1 Tax=unclassified Bradyrhizobium TaxID=2631580 RepID=UPI001BA57741|nr:MULTISPECIES: MFS transporter [unclassified Bradyrhizobium]MBR1218801.1 MFS transporter [Bradyrhizobium sp. U87765 SZCCT0131]MBR1261452.1 MFS transporter [Bradyrhizobium sp. U87765 SZCCT0134]MBR1306695.1 MFS transporter [Bradyrhizobium sp. U87765 SZCCT0110]MBR1317234.1 MFS transporter [Bradyrhizobium sp. U87765 SZCCT0109]MBR1350936.1 MFS transporter [Bradyrhizobium sp. U87765 SZCCT0048]